jgi:trichothecene 3-O-acetyltransferase
MTSASASASTVVEYSMRY